MDRLNVLICDDEVELVETLVERLALRDIDAHGVSCGTDALELLDGEAFDVVLLDVKMPGRGGLQILAEIRSRLPSQKVVLLTGHGSKADASEGLRLGACDYLMKPVKLSDLITILLACTGREGADDQ